MYKLVAGDSSALSAISGIEDPPNMRFRRRLSKILPLGILFHLGLVDFSLSRCQ
jgi:hypothetical protein